MYSEHNKEEVIKLINDRLDNIMDGVNFNYLIDEAWDYVADKYYLYDGQFTEYEEYEIRRELHKLNGFDMKWYDAINKPPQNETEKTELTQLEKDRIKTDYLMDRHKSGDFDE